MSKEKVDDLKLLVDRISFRLLATRNHPDHKWLYEEIKKYLYKKNSDESKKG